MRSRDRKFALARRRANLRSLAARAQKSGARRAQIALATARPVRPTGRRPSTVRSSTPPPPPRVNAGLSLPCHHRLRPKAARAPRPTFRARAVAGRGVVPACCHHDAAIYSSDLLLLTEVILYELVNAWKPSSVICAQFSPCRRDRGRRAPHGHLDRHLRPAAVRHSRGLRS